MIGGVLIPRQVSRGHQRNGHGVAENHLDRRGSDRREIEGAQFPLERQMHVHIADGSERISLDGGEGDKVGALGAHARYEAEELFGVAGLAE